MASRLKGKGPLLSVLTVLSGGEQVVLHHHPSLRRDMKAEFVQMFVTKRDEVERPVFLFLTEDETGLPVEEQLRYLQLIQSLQLKASHTLVLRDDELDGVEIEVLPVVTCPGCKVEHGAEELIRRLGLRPAGDMTDEECNVEKSLEHEGPYARRWAQQADYWVGGVKGAVGACLQWYDLEKKRNGPEPPDTECGIEGCDYKFKPQHLTAWLDEETRTALLTEMAAMEVDQAKEEEEEQAEDEDDDEEEEEDEEEEARGRKRPAPGGSSDAGAVEANQHSSGRHGGDDLVAARLRPPVSKEGAKDSLMDLGGGVVSSPHEQQGRQLWREGVAGPVGGQQQQQGQQNEQTKTSAFKKGMTDRSLIAAPAPKKMKQQQIPWGPRSQAAEHVKKLVEMGYPEDRAIRASRYAKTLDQAVEKLLEMEELDKKQEQAEEERRGQGGQTGGGKAASPSPFDFNNSDDEERRKGPERGVLRPVKTMQILWEYGSDSKKATVDLVAGAMPSWEEFQAQCARSLGLDTSRFFVDRLERVQGTRSGRCHSRYEVRNFEELVKDLNPGSYVEVRTVTLDPTPVQVDNMGEEEPITTLLQEFTHNPVMRKQISDLGKIYPRWRRVRGDGNCYYRAVMFGLCEDCILQPQRMKKLKALVRTTRSLPHDVRVRLLTWLEDRAGLYPLHHDFTDTDTGIDSGFVTLARCALADYIREHKDEVLQGGLSMEQMIEAEGMRLEEYCQEQVEKMGVDAEGFQLDLGLLPRILELTCHTWMVQRNTNELIRITRPDTGGGNWLLQVSLLLVPGHYSFLVTAGPDDSTLSGAVDADDDEEEELEVAKGPPRKRRPPAGYDEDVMPLPPLPPLARRGGAAAAAGEMDSKVSGNQPEKSVASGPQGGETDTGKSAFECRAGTDTDDGHDVSVSLQALLDLNNIVLHESNSGQLGPAVVTRISNQCRELADRETEEDMPKWRKLLDLCDAQEDAEVRPVAAAVECSKWLKQVQQALSDLISVTR